MTRRLLMSLAQLPLVLAMLGVFTFIGGIGAEYVVNRGDPFSGPPTGYTVLALIGLGLAATMFLVWFVGVALLLGVQTRRLGSGYGEAYRLIEAFKFDEAIPLLEQSVRDGKETVDVLMLLASAYAYAGRLAQAQQIADRAIDLYPQDASAYLTLSNVYRMQAVYEAAAEALEHASELEPESPVIWAELGFMHAYAGDQDAARAAFERAAIHSMPAMYAIRVYYQLASVYAESGDAVQAARAAAKMVSARDGLASWQSGLEALAGTSYGQQLAREMEQIERALQEADAGHTG